MKQAGIGFQSFERRLEPFEESLHTLARGNAIVSSLHNQYREINHRIGNYLRSCPDCFEIKSDRNKIMKQIEIFE